MLNTYRMARICVLLPVLASLCACSTPTSTSSQPPSPPPGTTVSTHDATLNPQAWRCAMRTQDGEVEAFGPTRLQANQLALRACVQQYSPERCQGDVKCLPHPAKN